MLSLLNDHIFDVYFFDDVVSFIVYIEFDAILMEMSINDGMKWFEDEGRKLMQGRYKNGSPEVWKTCMRNKYSWDKDLLEKAEKCSADKILEEIRSRNPEKAKHYEKKK